MTRHRVPILSRPFMPTLDWDGPEWTNIDPLTVTHFHARSSAHRPFTQVKVCLAGDSLHLLFQVDDRHVRSVATNDQQQVCRDSAVECFLAPVVGAGYFNFEFNCGGVKLAYHITDPGTRESGLRHYAPLAQDELDAVAVRATMPRTVLIETTEPITWRLSASIPLAVLARRVGPIDVRAGVAWRANFYKCADRSSHPHWGSWVDLGDAPLNFHQPALFGELSFA